MPSKQPLDSRAVPGFLARIPMAWRSFCREARQGESYAASWFVQRLYYRYIRRSLQSLASIGKIDMSRQSEIDIVIPTTSKDLSILPLCVESVHEFVRHEIGTIYVVAPASEEIADICERFGCTYVEESNFLPAPKHELECSGWILQQFIKLNGHRFVGNEHYLVLDSDTVFLRPQVFVMGSRKVLKYSDQYELLYDPSLRILLGSTQRFPVSFIAHHMLFTVELIKQLLRSMENRFSLPWYQAILDKVDHSRQISLSEYELYGNYVSKEFMKSHELSYWFGADLAREKADSLKSLVIRYGRRYASASFHHHR